MAAEPGGLDVAVVGGGPAGLAASIACARAGLSVAVLEKRADGLDKACGEGLLPPALAALEALGVGIPDGAESAPFDSLRYILEDGACAETRLPAGGGRGVRRTALIAALRRRAAELGVRLWSGATVKGFTRSDGWVEIGVGDGQGERSVRCRLLVGADGPGSSVRRSAGLEVSGLPPGSGRYGLRQHYRIAPWSSAVEVYFGPLAFGGSGGSSGSGNVEAYVTPVGPQTVNVAFLWRHGDLPPRINASTLLSGLPRLGERLGQCPVVSRARGSGPLERRVKGRTADRVALIGDAAGYLDAITGEGLSLAFRAALVLGEVAPAALARGASRAALSRYERAYAAAYARYVRLTRLVLALSGRGAVRRGVVHWLGAHPRAFEAMIAWGLKG